MRSPNSLPLLLLSRQRDRDAWEMRGSRGAGRWREHRLLRRPCPRAPTPADASRDLGRPSPSTAPLRVPLCGWHRWAQRQFRSRLSTSSCWNLHGHFARALCWAHLHTQTPHFGRSGVSSRSDWQERGERDKRAVASLRVEAFKRTGSQPPTQKALEKRGQISAIPRAIRGAPPGSGVGHTERGTRSCRHHRRSACTGKKWLPCASRRASSCRCPLSAGRGMGEVAFAGCPGLPGASWKQQKLGEGRENICDVVPISIVAEENEFTRKLPWQ